MFRQLNDYKMRFAANLSTLFKECPFMCRFDAAARNLFQHYELEFPCEYNPSAIRQAAEAECMECVLMSSFVDESDESFGSATFPGLEAKFCESVQKMIPFYIQLGVKKMQIIAGLEDKQISKKDQLNVFVGNLKSISNILASYDMTAVIKPLCQEVKPGYFLNTYDLAVEALTAAKVENVKLLLDIYQLHKITGDVKGNLERYYEYSGHVQVSQSPGRCEPYCEGGEIDYDYVFCFLKNKYHSDPIGLNYSPSAGLTTEQSLEWMHKTLLDIYTF